MIRTLDTGSPQNSHFFRAQMINTSSQFDMFELEACAPELTSAIQSEPLSTQAALAAINGNKMSKNEQLAVFVW